MKRLVITGPRKAEFDDVPMPVCADDGLLVRASATAISTGTEIRGYRATPVDDEGRLLYPSFPIEFPYQNGYSMVGQVVAKGSEVSGFAVGDRVFVPEPHEEYTAVAADSAVKLPESIPTERAVFLSILTVAQLALRKGHPTPGECVAIVGQGVIGLSTLAFCKAFRFRTLAIDTDDRRLKVAEKMGADVVVRPDDASFGQRVMAWSDGRGADLVIEAASSWEAIRTGMDVARTGGTIVVVARHTDTPAFSPVNHPYFHKDLTMLTTYGHERDGERWDRKASLALTVDLLAHGELDIGPMVTHEFDWSAIPEVYRRLDQGDSGLLGLVFRWPHD